VSDHPHARLPPKRRKIVFKTILSSVSLLSVILVVPVCGQDFSRLNFNIGGGMSAPINPTAKFVGLSGNFTVGAGYNLNKHNSISGEFMWNGLPSNIVFHPLTAPSGSMNLYTLTTNYRYHADSLGGSIFGAYAIAGGGWYYRYATIDKNFVVPPATVCSPIYFWWGYGCDTTGGVVSEQVAAKGNSAFGVDAGAGFTIRLSDKGWKFYVESRYNYAWSHRVPTTFAPVTFGFRYN
jgi:hypothetical protein